MEIRVLGPLEVVGDAGPIGVGGPQQRRVLAVLLSEPGRVLTYERLVEVLWPDGDEPPNARRSAITYVSRLRSAIGGNVVGTTDAGYIIDVGAVSVDADRFVALLDQARTAPSGRAVDVLDEALALWRGPVLGDLNGEFWARPFAKRLEELRLTALGDRIDALTAGGWDGRAIADVTSLIDAHPLREQFVERAMRGLHAIGQTADALRVFHRYRTDLADQTGLDPSASLVELESSMAAGSELEPSSSDLARPLRGYVLRELIGEGSFGAVYRATQPGVERDVAVKVIRPELADDRSFVRRFEAEAQLVARLEHPHIVPLYDFWRQPGGAFLVFRLLRGGSAEELLTRDGPLSVERTGVVLEQIASALSAAHAEHVVHRDVKPANILFDDQGSAYLADFGIAASLSDDVMTPQRWSAGSMLYASPEQLRDGIEDAQADQYALAVTVWELLTGHSPFVGRDASAVVASKLREPLGPVDEFRPGVAPALSAVLTRASSVHPSDRYANVAEFAVAWQRAFTGTIVGETDRPTHDGDPRQRIQAATMVGLNKPVANPYKGLRPFREGDVGDFHGRDALVERLASGVATTSFMAVVGPSGSGKSSLVLAGLVPRLRTATCLVVIMTPGDDPYASLAGALAHVAREEQVELLTVAALRRPEGIRDAIRSVADGDELVVVIDQLEELWTLTGEDDRGRFLAGLNLPLQAGFVRIVATVRADFFDRPLADPVLGPLASAHTFGVTPMTAGELHDAITVPAEQVGVRFEAALTSRLVAETIDQPGSLPLLQFTLAELFEGRHGATITADAYDELGGLAGSLSRQADEIYESFSPDDRAAVRRMFSRLVTPGEGNEDTRRRVTASDLAGVPEHVVAAFVGRRLVTSDRDRTTREPTVEVAHEVLLRSWPRLRTWLAQDRAWLRELRGLSAAASLWDAGGRDAADLYRGARLAVVGELADAHQDALTAVEQQFLAQSLDQAAEQQREAKRRLDEKVMQNRRLRRSLVGIAAVLVVALVAGGLAVVQRQRANRQQDIAVEQRTEAEKQRTIAQGEQAAAVDAATKAQDADTASQLTTLASRSLNVRSSQRDLAALLAVEAWKRSPDAESKSALFGTFTFDPGFLGYLTDPRALTMEGRAIPGTTQMLVVGYEQSDTLDPALPHVQDVVTGAEGVELEPLLDQPVGDYDFGISTSGRFAAVRGGALDQSTSAIAAYDLSTGKKMGPAITVPPEWYEAAIDPTGTYVIAASGVDGEAAVYRAATGDEVARIPALPDAPTSDGGRDGGAVVYGPDGRLYVGSRGDLLRVFDPTSFELVQQIAVPPMSTGGEMKFSADGSMMVARGIYEHDGLQTAAIARIELPSGTTTWTVTGDDFTNGECASFAFSTQSGRLWCGDYFGLIHERSLRTGALTGATLENQKGWVRSLDVISSSSGEVLTALSNNAGVIARWGVSGSGPIQQSIAQGHEVVGVLQDGAELLVGTPSGLASPLDLQYSLWDTATDAPLSVFPQFLYARTAGHFVYGLYADQQVGTYNVSTKQKTAFTFSLDPVPSALTLSDDGSVMAAGYTDGHVDIVDAASGTVLQTLHIAYPDGKGQPAVNQLAFSADHSKLYVSGGSLWLFDLAAGTMLAFKNDAEIGGVIVSATDAVAATSFDGRLALVDGTSLADVASLPGARGYIQSMEFSDDGQLLVGLGNDGTASLYDVDDHVRLGDPVRLHGQTGLEVAMASDASVLAISGVDGPGASLWDLDPGHWVDAACMLAGRNLTAEEWATYIGDLGDYRATCPQFPGAT